MRHSLLASLLEVLERNARLREHIAMFEIAPIFLQQEEGLLPEERQQLVVVVTGPRTRPAWQGSDSEPLDFYDLKGILEELFAGLHLAPVSYAPAEHPSFHPGKCAYLQVGDGRLGVMGELHPRVRARYDLPATQSGRPIVAAELDLQAILDQIPARWTLQPVASFPPVLEDLAVVVDEDLPAGQVEALIRQTGGRTLAGVRLFDVFRDERLGAGKKSLAYSLTYQAADRTLTDADVQSLRQKIIRRLEHEFGARLRS
jgi:phenylalanyl-tRNA synthetase beta chain